MSVRILMAATIACIGYTATAAEQSQTLDKQNLVAAIDNSNDPDLIDGTYERVIFYLAGGKVVTLSGELIEAGSVGTLSYPISYGATQRCKLNSTSTPVSGATTTVYWCEPNPSKLQSDVYQLTLSGTAPQYVVTFADVDCTAERSRIPTVVWNRFCVS